MTYKITHPLRLIANLLNIFAVFLLGVGIAWLMMWAISSRVQLVKRVSIAIPNQSIEYGTLDLNRYKTLASGRIIPMQVNIVVSTTIQAAIDAAQPGDTVIIPSGIYTESLTLNKPVSLTGVSSATTVIHAVSGQNVLTITGSVIDNSVVVANLTLTGGERNGPYPSTRGGGIFITGAAKPLIQNVVIKNNYAQLGGGIFIDFLASAKLTNVSVISNTAEYDGGGIWNAGVLEVSNSTFMSNSLNSIFGAEGGGIYNYATLVITNSTFYTNAATFGGGIFNNQMLTISNSVLSGNTVRSLGGGVDHNKGTSIISNTVVSNNKSSVSSGGIYIAEGSMQINNSVIANNLAEGSGGSGSGGGIGNYQGTLFISDSHVSGNRVAGPNISGASSFGGGIDTSSGIVNIVRSTFDNNSAHFGGGISSYNNLLITDTTFYSNTAFHSGGGVSLEGLSTVTIHSSVFYSNTAASAGGGIHNGSSFLSINNSTIFNNNAWNGGGVDNENGTTTLGNATIVSNTAGLGGGIFNENGTTTLENATIVSNKAYGGGVFHSGGIVNIKNSILAENLSGASPDCIGTVTSQGYNLIKDASDCTITGTLTGNIVGLSPHLGPLQDNGGAVLTRALLENSPAIDAGSCSGVTTDQRGFSRPVDILTIPNADDSCDIGAFEFRLLVNQVPFIPFNPIPADGSSNISSTQTLTWQSGDPNGDVITYSIAFGVSNPPPLVATTTQTSYKPSLSAGITYYWRITAADATSRSVGPVWVFTTTTMVTNKFVYLPIVVK